MARYKGPRCKLCRREGMKLYLKGSRCESDKCAIVKRNYAPGQHGNVRKRASQFGTQLREKQKVKRIYGLLEKQFKKYVDNALNTKGVSGEVLMQNLESRLDNVVYRGGFATSRAQARQFVRSGFFMLNGKVVNVPSIEVSAGDIIKPVNFEKLQLKEGFILPDWIEANVKEKYIKYSRLPTLDEVADNLNIQLIIEFYSR